MHIFHALVVSLLLLVEPVSSINAAEPTPAGAQVLLFQKHVDKGMDCTACHQENPAATPVAMEKCLSCHGPYDKLADKTDKTEPNPHGSHQGDLSCDSCHHAHKASDNYCSQCHQFEFKVP
jgi:hypothetical protein